MNVILKLKSPKTSTSQKNPSNDNAKLETDRGLLTIGGGTLCNIWKKNMKQKDSNLKSVSIIDFIEKIKMPQ